MLKILPVRLEQYLKLELPDIKAGFRKRQRNQRSNSQHPMDHRKSKRVQEKHLLLLDYVKAFDYLKWSEVKSLSHVRHFVTTWTIAHQAAPSIHGIFQARVLEWDAIAFSEKNIYFCFIDYAKAFDCVDHKKLENSSRYGNTRPPDLPPEKSICMFKNNS